jgi:hypothetical protein
MLEDIGFQIVTLEVEYRPTKLTTGEGGGLDGWLRLMGANMIEVLDEDKRDAAIKLMCDNLCSVVTKDEDGSQWLGYVRLRGVARKN